MFRSNQIGHQEIDPGNFEKLFALGFIILCAPLGKSWLCTFLQIGSASYRDQ